MGKRGRWAHLDYGFSKFIGEFKEEKNRRKSTWDSAKAKMNLDQTCREAMCIFKGNVICVSDSFTMTLSKCHVMKVIQGPIILLSF